MDGFDNDRQQVAASLLELQGSRTQDPVTPPRTPKVEATVTPPFKMNTSPEFRLTGAKRERDNITFFYASDDCSVVVPMKSTDTFESFYARREHITQLALSNKDKSARVDVYCTWRKQLLSIRFTDGDWTLFRESLQQKRYACGTIQLVVSRLTCGQWNDGPFCRNCSHRNWRATCLQPKYIHHLLPLPCVRGNNLLCDNVLEVKDMQPVVLQIDVAQWTKRVPTCAIRA